MVLFILIFFTMVIVIGTAMVGGFSFYLKRRRIAAKSQKEIEEIPPYRSLFTPTEAEMQTVESEENEKLAAEKRETIRQSLLVRADETDFTILPEAKNLNDSALYSEMLDLLTEKAGSEHKELKDLVDYISQNELPADEKLVETVLAKWQENPAAYSLSKILHVSALANSAEIYLKTIETIFEFWKQKRIGDVSGDKIISLFESHYWLLSSEEKTSGGGFLLKEKLAEIKGEILQN